MPPTIHFYLQLSEHRAKDLEFIYVKKNIYFQNGVILDLFFGFIVVDKTAESELMYSNMIFEFLGINKVSSNLKCRLVFPSSKG